MTYNITIISNNFQTQLEKWCRMIYNFTIFGTIFGLEWSPLDWT